MRIPEKTKIPEYTLFIGRVFLFAAAVLVLGVDRSACPFGDQPRKHVGLLIFLNLIKVVEFLTRMKYK